jgi:hypothetical protein
MKKGSPFSRGWKLLESSPVQQVRPLGWFRSTFRFCALSVRHDDDGNDVNLPLNESRYTDGPAVGSSRQPVNSGPACNAFGLAADILKGKTGMHSAFEQQEAAEDPNKQS